MLIQVLRARVLTPSLSGEMHSFHPAEQAGTCPCQTPVVLSPLSAPGRPSALGLCGPK